MLILGTQAIHNIQYTCYMFWIAWVPMMISAKFERKLFSKLDGKLDKMLSSIASLPNEKASLKDRVAELKQGLERQKRRGDDAAQIQQAKLYTCIWSERGRRRESGWRHNWSC